MKSGWLKRGLENAKREAEMFPPHRREALVSDEEFKLEVSGMKKYKYAKLFKNGNTTSPKEFSAEDFEEAKAFVADEVNAKGTYIITAVYNSLHLSPEYIKIDFKDLKKYKGKKKKEKIKLPEPTKIVLEYFGGNIGLDLDPPPTKKQCEEYGLLIDTHKQYYAYCYWGSGDNGGFVDKEDIAGMMAEQIKRGDDDNYSFSLFDVKNKCEVRAEPKIDVEIVEY